MCIVPYLSRWIYHSAGLWGRLSSHNPKSKAFANIPFSLHIHTRPPNYFPEMLLNFGDALVPFVCYLMNSRVHYLWNYNAIVSHNKALFLAKFFLNLKGMWCISTVVGVKTLFGIRLWSKRHSLDGDCTRKRIHNKRVDLTLNWVLQCVSFTGLHEGCPLHFEA